MWRRKRRSTPQSARRLARASATNTATVGPINGHWACSVSFSSTTFTSYHPDHHQSHGSLSMPAVCADCGGPTVWDDAAASDICTSCGSLADPTQVILTSQDWRTDSNSNTHEYSLRNTAAPNILKTRSNHTLAGQGQAIRDQKNAVCPQSFLSSCPPDQVSCS